MLHSCLIAMASLHLDASNRIEWQSVTSWESRYVAEGRDELEDSGLMTTELSASYRGFDFSALAALGDSTHYQELQLTLAYGDEFQNLVWSAGYTHLEFEPDSGDGDEFFLELEAPTFGEIVVGAALVYSVEAKGSFLELSLRRSFDVIEDRFSLSPYALYGFDFGYRTGAHDGPNHLQLGIECQCAISENLSLFAFLAHSYVQTDVAREGLGDVSWIGLGLQASF